ncbi:hypothetical protein ABZ806_11535 [Spirillospora sp. NPDC047418]
MNSSPASSATTPTATAAEEQRDGDGRRDREQPVPSRQEDEPVGPGRFGDRSAGQVGAHRMAERAPERHRERRDQVDGERDRHPDREHCGSS